MVFSLLEPIFLGGLFMVLLFTVVSNVMVALKVIVRMLRGDDL